MTAYKDCTFVQAFTTTDDITGRTFYGSVRDKVGGELLAEIAITSDATAKTVTCRIPVASMNALPTGRLNYAIDYVTEGSSEPFPWIGGELLVKVTGAKPE